MRRNLGLAGCFLLSWICACSGQKARVVEWRNDELTACCNKDNCGDEDFIRASAQNCRGTMTLIGGTIRPQVGAYSEERSDKKTIRLSPEVEERKCRTFKCQGAVIPP